MQDNQRDDAADVRAWLSGIKPVGDLWSSSFDTAEAIQRARLRHRRRLFVTTGTAAVAVLALLTPLAFTGWPRPHTQAPGPSLAPPTQATSATAVPPTVVRCTIADLPVPNGLGARGVSLPARVFVTAMDPTGAYIAASAFGVDNYVAAVILWHNQVARILPTGRLGAIMTTVAVNSHGVVAGTGEGAGAAGFAWVYRDGVATRLPNVPGYNRLVQVYGVNAAGDVLGSELSDSADHSVVVVWPAAAPHHPRIQTALTDKLDLINAAFGDNGQLYAWSGTQTMPVVWTGDGQRHDLALPDGFTAGAVTGVRGRWAFGLAFVKLPPPRTPVSAHSIYSPVPVRWALDSGRVDVIADASPIQLDPSIMAAFVSSDAAPASGYMALGGTNNGRTFVLPAAKEAATPVAVSDDGSLVAGSVGPPDDAQLAGKTRPVVWHC